jgi:hypothetical protein
MKKRDNRVKGTKFAALAVAAVMFCTMLSGCGSRDVSALTEAVKIASFSEERVSVITVAQGTAADMIGLPDVLAASIIVTAAPPADSAAAAEPSEQDTAQTQAAETAELRDVPVSWQCADYDPDTAGAYVFTAQLQPGYVYEGGMPTVTVEVKAASEPAISDAPEPEASGEPEVPIEPEGETGGIVITAFTNDPIAVEVPRGTAIEDIPLPKTLPAIDGNGDAIEVPVTWTNIIDSTNEFEIDPNDYETGRLSGYGPWIFTASVGEGYAYAGESVTASVKNTDCNEIESFCGITTGGLIMRFVIFEGETVNLPTEVSAFMADGGYKNVPVSWSGGYDTQTAGTYELTMNVKGGYTGGGATADIVVIKDYDKGQGDAQ